MSTDYGVWCMDCNKGYLTDEHGSRTLNALVMAKHQIAAAVRAVNELNNMPITVNVSLVCDDLWPNDKERVLQFIATHHAHNVQVVDEYKFHDLGWAGNCEDTYVTVTKTMATH